MTLGIIPRNWTGVLLELGSGLDGNQGQCPTQAEHNPFFSWEDPMRNVTLLVFFLFVCGCEAASTSRSASDATAISQDTSSASADVTTPPVDTTASIDVPPFTSVDTTGSNTPDEGTSSTEEAPLPSPDVAVCVPTPGYHDGQVINCKHVTKTCILRWNSASCTWSCGGPPDGSAPLYFWDASPQTLSSFLADPDLDCKPAE